ncbi:MAG: hypothetical protein V1751_11895 [Pseudomonadota bacterium]
MTALAGEGQEIVMDTIFAFHAGKPVNRLQELLPDQWAPLPKDDRGLILVAKT